jgi:hypothetical protein
VSKTASIGQTHRSPAAFFYYFAFFKGALAFYRLGRGYRFRFFAAEVGNALAVPGVLLCEVEQYRKGIVQASAVL